jgi:hypothetical protein
MIYDHLIIAGERIGPVRLGGRVSDAIKHLGNPDRVVRSKYAGQPNSPGYVVYDYNEECIFFKWEDDSAVNPTIYDPTVTCDKWRTPEGVRVGLPVTDAAARLFGPYCSTTTDDGELLIYTMDMGIWLWAKDRNSAINQIRVWFPKKDRTTCN